MANERQYKGAKLRKKGFVSKSDAEKDLRRAMNDLDAAERGEFERRQRLHNKL
ncbi:MAG TPA: hypothetical protein VGN86_08405 [Pyrinomonadaceae bacterium]|nr:hypothetical protein [Pyrinomonadaceae bacterium]